ncbi:MAG TPA: methyltransferase domain-containing protein [Burkholderiales bacterium]|nr:methyltransferase domain-containing protein [Burkholderiales bacterium]
MTETYTPGHSEGAVAFMSRRRLDPNGAFFRPLLSPGMRVLDCGCGPGTITCDIALVVAPGKVTAVDASASQLALAEERARDLEISNVEFREADAYALPFTDGSFDAVFSHALLEHLSHPQRAAAEFFRVLKPGGAVGVCTPDWGAFLIAPQTPALLEAFDAYTRLQDRNGGDTRVGRKLGDLLDAAGFVEVRQQARYENYSPLATIGDFLALNLEEAGDREHAATWRTWARGLRGMFAQAWVSAVGRKP